MPYRWREGYGFSEVTAEEVASELDRIRDVRGGGEVARPSDVVEESRPESAPLHPLFEWDDSVAAEKYRVEQARGILRAVVSYEEADPEVEVPAYIKVHVEHGAQSYYPAARVMSDAEMMKSVVDRALADLKSWQERYRHLKQLAGLMAAIDGAIVAATKPAKAKRSRVTKS